ncbi:MAG: ABC transporter ATP-binding protein [Woeseiaceae bacterium]
MKAISVENVSKSFGAVRAIESITFDVPAGTVFGFLGPNGAGKTTLMRLLLGLLRPDTGTIALFGENLAQNRALALNGVGALIEEPSLYSHLSGRDNLMVTAKLLGIPSTEVARVIHLVRLSDAASRKVNAYSMGMRQRLGLARAMLGRPRLLVLDEPTNGLDPESASIVRELILSLSKETGCTVFLSSHVLSDVEKIVDHAIIMRDGRIVLSEPMKALKRKNECVRIVSADIERSAQHLASMGADIVGTSEELITIRPPDTSDINEVLARWNSRLVEAGHSVSQIHLAPATLEHFYYQTAEQSQGSDT